MTTDDDALIKNAINALVNCGLNNPDPLIALTASSDGSVREVVATALGTINNQNVVEPLKRL